jgi:hypothetical protein
MRPRDRELAEQLSEGLLSFDKKKHPLPGIRVRASFEAFVEQVLESLHRIKYVSVLRRRNLSNLRAEPASELFDPLKAAALHSRQGQVDEAFWLVFLFVHFGKHKRAGWRLARDVYGALGSGMRWDWARTSADPASFRQWLAANVNTLRGDGIARYFGNHRKYQSLDATSPAGTGATVESYVRWVAPQGTHQLLVQNAQTRGGNDPRRTFDHLYRSMDAVVSFGRMAKFDYLTMLGKLGLAGIEPGSAYLEGATGPLRGARLLLGGSVTAALSAPTLDGWLVQLGTDLNVGMQVLEDSLCNWQKTPGKFVPFRG